MTAHRPFHLPTILLATILAVVATRFSPASAADPSDLPPGARKILHRRDDPARYQNFVVNWDAGTEILCAVVRTPADYALLFHPAPVIGGKKPFAPPDDAFTKERLLVVARVVGGDGGSVLEVERVVENDGVLEVHGRFKRSGAASSFSVKQAALAWIPAYDARKVTFFENGEPIVTLDVGEGEWVVPPLPDAPPTPR